MNLGASFTGHKGATGEIVANATSTLDWPDFETKKRQPPLPMRVRLLSHMRRGHRLRLFATFFVKWSGAPVQSVKTAFMSAVKLARLGRISPHTLRRTAATWLMQTGVDKWEAAGFLGMSVEMFGRVYGHHHPDHLRQAAHALVYGRRQLLVNSSVSRQVPRAPQQQVIENIGGHSNPNQTVMSELGDVDDPAKSNS